MDAAVEQTLQRKGWSSRSFGLDAETMSREQHSF
jgi:hypothetical protein